MSLLVAISISLPVFAASVSVTIEWHSKPGVILDSSSHLFYFPWAWLLLWLKSMLLVPLRSHLCNPWSPWIMESAPFVSFWSPLYTVARLVPGSVTFCHFDKTPDWVCQTVDNLARVSSAHKFLWTLPFPLTPAASLFVEHYRLLAFVRSFSVDILPQAFGGFLSFKFFLSHLFKLLHLGSLSVFQMFACIGF